MTPKRPDLPASRHSGTRRRLIEWRDERPPKRRSHLSRFYGLYLDSCEIALWPGVAIRKFPSRRPASITSIAHGLRDWMCVDRDRHAPAVAHTGVPQVTSTVRITALIPPAYPPLPPTRRWAEPVERDGNNLRPARQRCRRKLSCDKLRSRRIFFERVDGHAFDTSSSHAEEGPRRRPPRRSHAQRLR